MHSLFDINAQLPAFNVVTEAKEAEVNVAKNRSFSLTSDSIITFDRAYIDSDLFQAYEENQIFFVTRARDNMRFQFLGQQDIPNKKGLQLDFMTLITRKPIYF